MLLLCSPDSGLVLHRSSGSSHLLGSSSRHELGDATLDELKIPSDNIVNKSLAMSSVSGAPERQQSHTYRDLSSVSSQLRHQSLENCGMDGLVELDASNEPVDPADES